MRMKHLSLLIGALLALPASAQRYSTSSILAGLNAISGAYTDSLTTLVAHKPGNGASSTQPNRYLFRLFGPGTLYASVLNQQMDIDYESPLQANHLPSLGTLDDGPLEANQAANDMLARAYSQIPQLFATTQETLEEGGKLRENLTETVKEEVKLAERVTEVLPDIEVEVVEPEVKKPNFWKFSGKTGLQFTQNYFSKNWYKGGENAYSMLGNFSFSANYDNQRRTKVSNNLEAQLGFQTSESSDPKFRPTSNLLRLTSTLGIKAIKKWDYSAQLQLQTQPYMSYQGSSRTVTGDFVSPLYVRSSLGMDLNIKQKRFTGKLHLAPISYVITYVERKGLIGRYGIHEGHHSKHEWGPNIDFTFDYKITNDISWHNRLYWFSNLHMTLIENEHTFDFKVNKFITAKIFMYPRFEDIKYYNLKYDENHERTEESARKTHWMFKEFLSLGLSYDF